MALLDVRDLRVQFNTRHGTVRAVDGVSFSLEREEALGIVGESGSGKSVTCLALMGLLPRLTARVAGGSAHFDGTDLFALSERQLRPLRGGRISMIFQDPMTSLNPYLRISTQMIETLEAHTTLSGDHALSKSISALEEVGIPEASRRIHAFPHEFSGGMRQRVMIAMAMLNEPELLIADEPTTALDVTIQAQILELVRGLRARHGTAVIWVTHDLAVTRALCERTMVMYAGRVVESGPVNDVFARTLHPYAACLIRSIPGIQKRGARLVSIPGLPPDPTRLPPGCAFAPRCPFAVESCTRSAPSLLPNDAAHRGACLRVHAKEIVPHELA